MNYVLFMDIFIMFMKLQKYYLTYILLRTKDISSGTRKKPSNHRVFILVLAGLDLTRVQLACRW